MKYLIEYLKNLQNQKIITSKRAGLPTIKSTQRNIIKRESENAMLKDLQEKLNDFVIVEKTDKGIIIALEHDSLLTVENATGEICFEINIKVKNLDYDVVNEREIYIENEKLKKEERKAKAESKKRKIARDKKIRADKKKITELRKIKKR